jgi:(2Fe-2S) ferredoxin
MKDLSSVSHHIFICHGSDCKKHGAGEITDTIRELIKSEGIKEQVHITKTHCNDQCKRCPVVIVQPEGVWYKDVTKKVAKRIVREHIIAGSVVEDNVLYAHGHRICDDYKLEHSKLTDAEERAEEQKEVRTKRNESGDV